LKENEVLNKKYSAHVKKRIRQIRENKKKNKNLHYGDVYQKKKPRPFYGAVMFIDE